MTPVTTNVVITKEETFGPVAPLYRFKSEAERSTPYGYSATSAASGASLRPSIWFYSRGHSAKSIWRDRRGGLEETE